MASDLAFSALSWPEIQFPMVKGRESGEGVERGDGGAAPCERWCATEQVWG